METIETLFFNECYDNPYLNSKKIPQPKSQGISKIKYTELTILNLIPFYYH